MCDEGLACEHRRAEGEQRGQWVNLQLRNPPPQIVRNVKCKKTHTSYVIPWIFMSPLKIVGVIPPEKWTRVPFCIWAKNWNEICVSQFFENCYYFFYYLFFFPLNTSTSFLICVGGRSNTVKDITQSMWIFLKWRFMPNRFCYINVDCAN